jgi:hypothetical protein
MNAGFTGCGIIQLCNQGTTLVVPKMQQNKRGALAPEGMPADAYDE